jgi:hypothetical protein
MTLVLDGTNNTYLSATERGQLMTLSTAQATTSGTTVDFTGIPTWAKKITVIFNGVSTNGAAVPLIQLGNGSIITTGYIGSAQNITTSPSSVVTAASTGFPVTSTSASNTLYGLCTFVNITSNTWVVSGTLYTNSTATNIINGSLALSGTLDRIRLTTVGGTDAFDAGSVNILIEGSL